ncbi:MBL fold metallo-hydrolase [Streptomyces tateyamensis]|uniref:MBL fold metallo-hydrolase n=1 Tax=Streptomyces tateyamensis TaxID=565073 RepID=A0A2V4P4D8_9ACTN|nr:MBL fold metallo-hydrolase [Streptomyces tateyamensis]PYC77719.1 MBL fold metallo-hydrolase [Streptomyces tateyamensis]
MTSIDFHTAAPVPGSLDVTWYPGHPHLAPGQGPLLQVHRYEAHTVILRQDKTVNYEAPFLFLLFGNERALLLDTGATEEAELFPLRATVDQLISEWLVDHPRERYELVVAHTHGHGDHVAADGQFADRPDTRIVGREEEAVREFFGFGENWPAGEVGFDLGGRELRLIGSPGHHAASVTVYDPWTGLLLTGDTVLPGRLYIADTAAFLATMDRLTAFAASHPVTHVLGCHVEMTARPGRDFPIGAQYQPGELPLQLTPAHLTAIREAAAAVADRPGVYPHQDFVVYNRPTERDMQRLVRRGELNRVLTAQRPAL